MRLMKLWTRRGSSQRDGNRRARGAVGWGRTLYYSTLLSRQLNFPGRIIVWSKPLIFLSKLLLYQIQTFSCPKLMNLPLREIFYFSNPSEK